MTARPIPPSYPYPAHPDRPDYVPEPFGEPLLLDGTSDPNLVGGFTAAPTLAAQGPPTDEVWQVSTVIWTILGDTGAGWSATGYGPTVARVPALELLVDRFVSGGVPPTETFPLLGPNAPVSGAVGFLGVRKNADFGALGAGADVYHRVWASETQITAVFDLERINGAPLVLQGYLADRVRLPLTQDLGSPPTTQHTVILRGCRLRGRARWV